MTPSGLIKSTGLRRAAVHLDMMSAMNRYQFTKNGREIDNLTDEQLGMLLIEVGAVPGTPIWQHVEQQIGYPLTAEGTP